jgi:hypothetical protein
MHSLARFGLTHSQCGQGFGINDRNAKIQKEGGASGCLKEKSNDGTLTLGNTYTDSTSSLEAVKQISLLLTEGRLNANSFRVVQAAYEDGASGNLGPYPHFQSTTAIRFDSGFCQDPTKVGTRSRSNINFEPYPTNEKGSLWGAAGEYMQLVNKETEEEMDIASIGHWVRLRLILNFKSWRLSLNCFVSQIIISKISSFPN